MTLSADIGLTPVFTLFFALTGGWLFCSLLAFVFRALEAGTQKTFYNLLARQLTACALACSLLPAASFTAAMIYGLSAGAAPLTAEPPATVRGAMAAIILFLIIQSLALGSWKKLRKNAPAQLVICLAAFGFALGGIGSACALTPAFIYPPGLSGFETAAGLTPALVFFQASPTGWLFLAALGTSLFALGLSISACWLLLRRNRDDFGRDYYNFALNRVAWLALAVTCGAIILIVAAVWLLYDTPANGARPELYLPLAASGLQAVCSVVWLLTARSGVPLRLKAGHWAVLALMLGSLFLLLLHGGDWLRLAPNA